MKKIAILAFVISTLLVATSCMYTCQVFAQPQKGERPEDEVLNFIREINPQMLEHLERVRAINPAEYGEIVKGAANQYRELKMLEATNPVAGEKAREVAKLEGQVQSLARQYRETTSTQEKEELQKQIKAMLLQAIEGKISLEELRVTVIEKDLKALKERIDQRKQAKAKIVEHKFSEITSEDYLRW